MKKEYLIQDINNNLIPIMKMKNVSIDENMIGYVYVFKYKENMIKDDNSYQYKCYSNLIPYSCYRSML